jgi:putative intracellular protease/amidase
MLRVLMFLPAMDFDPSEAAVTWRVLRQAGVRLDFATPQGLVALPDDLMLSGEGLDFWSFVPFLRRFRLLGLLLRANRAARRAFVEMERDPAFNQPLAYEDVRVSEFDGLILPGGHRARGMRPFLEDTRLHGLVRQFFQADKPVGAICHGVLLAARSGALAGRRTTALTWQLEKSAWLLMRLFGRFWDANYYRTYPEPVEHEVRRLGAEFRDAPEWWRRAGLVRDSWSNPAPAWVVRDGNYVSARWPGDAHTFARTFLQVLNQSR